MRLTPNVPMQLGIKDDPFVLLLIKNIPQEIITHADTVKRICMYFYTWSARYYTVIRIESIPYLLIVFHRNEIIYYRTIETRIIEEIINYTITFEFSHMTRFSSKSLNQSDFQQLQLSFNWHSEKEFVQLYPVPSNWMIEKHTCTQ